MTDTGGRIPRIRPGACEDIGRLNFAIASLLGAVTGGGQPNVFTTLARHRRLFRKWLWFASALMPGGLLPRVDSELLILRVAHNCGCAYEWHHHERLGRHAGLSDEDVLRVREGPDTDGWSPRRRLLLLAADELHTDRTISDPVWTSLCALFPDPMLIELCLLVGHYEMLAMTLNALAVQPDPLPPGPPPRAMRSLLTVVERCRGRGGDTR